MHQIKLGFVNFTAENDFSGFIHHKNEGTFQGWRVNAKRLTYLILTGSWLDHAKILSLLSPCVEADRKTLSDLIATVFKEANLTDNLRRKMEAIQKSLLSDPSQPPAHLQQTPPILPPKKELSKEEKLQELLKICPNLDMPLRQVARVSEREREFELSDELKAKPPREQLRFFEWYLNAEYIHAKAEFEHSRAGLKRFIDRVINPNISDHLKVRDFDIDYIHLHFSIFALGVGGHSKVIQQIARKSPDDELLQQAAQEAAQKHLDFERMNQRFDEMYNWVMNVGQLFGGSVTFSL